MELRGILLNKSEVKTFESGFSIQEFYLDCKRFNPNTGEPIENVLKFQTSRSVVLDTLSGLSKGQNVIVSFNPQGRVYDKKDGTGNGHAQNLDAWKIEIIQNNNTSGDHVGIDEDPDLPF